MISGIVTLIIALIGLLGYTADETNRRGREIAIRKVNGATAVNILRMLSRDISYIALPALAIGVAVAYINASGEIRRTHPSQFLYIHRGGLVCLCRYHLLRADTSMECGE